MFTIEELKRLAEWGDALLDSIQRGLPAYLPPAADHALRTKIAEIIDGGGGAVKVPRCHRSKVGVQVFRFTLAIGNTSTGGRRQHPLLQATHRYCPRRALAWAPTMNELNGLVGWQKAQLREAIDWKITEARHRYPSADMGIKRLAGKKGRIGRLIERGNARPRIVHVKRESSRKPDEVSADVIGGKVPIDRLRHAGILFDDSEKWCIREAHWQQVPPDRGRVIIEVFELPTKS